MPDSPDSTPAADVVTAVGPRTKVQIITGIAQSPMNASRWCLDLACGHEIGVTACGHEIGTVGSRATRRATADPDRVPGYSNFGGGPFAPMGMARRAPKRELT